MRRLVPALFACVVCATFLITAGDRGRKMFRSAEQARSYVAFRIKSVPGAARTNDPYANSFTRVYRTQEGQEITYLLVGDARHELDLADQLFDLGFPHEALLHYENLAEFYPAFRPSHVGARRDACRDSSPADVDGASPSKAIHELDDRWVDATSHLPYIKLATENSVTTGPTLPVQAVARNVERITFQLSRVSMRGLSFDPFRTANLPIAFEETLPASPSVELPIREPGVYRVTARAAGIECSFFAVRADARLEAALFPMGTAIRAARAGRPLAGLEIYNGSTLKGKTGPDGVAGVAAMRARYCPEHVECCKSCDSCLHHHNASEKVSNEITVVGQDMIFTAFIDLNNPAAGKFECHFENVRAENTLTFEGEDIDFDIEGEVRLIEPSLQPETRGLAVQVAYDRPLESLKIGDEVTATVALTAEQSADYVMALSPIPAGCEVVRGSGEGEFARFEDRFDKSIFFLRRLEPGRTAVLRYRMRASFAGSFAVLPPTASIMYNEAISGSGPVQSARISE